MTRMIAVDKLVGLTDVADRLEIGVTSAWNIINRPGRLRPFPEPVTYISNKPVWNWDDVEKWAKDFTPRGPHGKKTKVNGKRR